MIAILKLQFNKFTVPRQKYHVFGRLKRSVSHKTFTQTQPHNQKRERTSVSLIEEK